MAKRNSHSIGACIKKLRENANMTQSALAKKMSYASRELMSYWEKDQRIPNAKDIVRLAEIFKVSCDFILRGVARENVNIQRETGLSNRAIETLKYYVQERVNGNYEDALKGLNAVFDTAAPYKFFQHIHCYMAKVIADPLEMYDKDAEVDTETGAIRFGEYTFQPDMLDKCFLLAIQEYLIQAREKEVK